MFPIPFFFCVYNKHAVTRLLVGSALTLFLGRITYILQTFLSLSYICALCSLPPQSIHMSISLTVHPSCPPTRFAIFEHTLSHLLSTNWLCVSYNLQDQQEDNPFLQVASLNLLSVSFKLWSHLWIILLPFISSSSQSVAASECNLGLRSIFHFHALFHIYNQCSLSFHSSMTVSKMMVHAICLLQLYYTELQNK